jgi:hypothetical protein
MMKDGGAYLDIARTLNVHHSDIKRWLDGSRPDYLELTRHIPATLPNSGHKWLPLNLDRAFVPTTFIQVPQVITHHKHTLPVLDQLHPLRNKNMQRWQTRFGSPNKIDAFYYLLGLIASDFQKSKPRISSTELVLTLSKNYTWSQTLGDAACYYLGQLGIHAKQVKDRDSSAGPNMCHSWRSQKTPLGTWIMHTCLGLQPNQTTTYDPLYARWLLTPPHQHRIAFLQGVADGDGWASIRDQCIGIYAGPNILLIQDLLQSLSVHSETDGKRVRIRTQKGIIQAAKLPFFRFAESRQNNSTKMAEMMNARKRKKERLIPKNISRVILQLHKQNKSSGFIAEYIFDHFSISYDRRSISYHIQIKEKTDQECK